MRTELEILNKIKEIETDIHTLNEQRIDKAFIVSDNVMRVASISDAKKQLQLLKWVLKG